MKLKKQHIVKRFVATLLISVIIMGTVNGCSHNTMEENKEVSNNSCEIQDDVNKYLKAKNITKSKITKCLEYKELIKNIHLPSKESEVHVSDEEVEKYVQAVIESYGKLKKITTRKIVKKGDFVRLKYKTYYKGKELSQMDNEVIKVGAGNYDKNLERELIGLKVGKNYAKKLIVPDNDVNAEMSGKTVKIKIKIESINQYIEPKLNDKFVKRKLGYNSVKEFYRDKKKVAEEEKKMVDYIENVNQLFQFISEKCEFDIDKDEIANYALEQVTYYKQLAYIENLTLEQYAKDKGMTLDDLYQECYEVSEREVKRILIVGCLARELQIRCTSDNQDIKMDIEEKYTDIENQVIKKFI